MEESLMSYHDKDDRKQPDRDEHEKKRDLDPQKQYGEIKQARINPHKTRGKLFPSYQLKEGEGNEVRAPDVPTSKVKSVEKQSPASEVKKSPGGNDPVKFISYSPSLDSKGKVSDTAADISGAQNAGDIIMRSGNWYVDLSVNSGGLWKRFDTTTLFPNNLGNGFCCDQIVHYVPSIDRFVWYMQHDAGADGSGVFRIAVASPANMKRNFAAAWTYWDFHSDDFGLKGHDLDYPDLTWTDQFLYFSTDDQTEVKLLVCRIPLKELAAGRRINCSCIDIGAKEAKNDHGSHLLQNSHDGAFWAGHKDSATLWVYSWPDSSSRYSWTAVGVSKYPDGTLSSTSPGGVDWLKYLDFFPRFGVLGATRSGNTLWFAWSASSGQADPADPASPKYANAHVRVAQVDISTMKTVAEIQIWNNDYAFAYPALSTNMEGEVGIVLGWGGKSNNANAAVGILGDYVVWYENGSDVATTRWGDFVTCRSSGVDSARFAGFGYYIKKDTTRPSGYYFDPYYVLFGRS
jgi:hypothetical protein